MIQRIQSLYFIIAALIQLLYAFGTKYSGTSNEGDLVFGMKGLMIGDELMKTDYKPMLLAFIAIVMIVVAVFSFKKHKLQIKLANGFLMIIFVQLFFLAMLYMELIEIPSADISLGWSVFMLPIAAVFVVLGKRGVRKDWNLLKSVDRIR